ncbi:MAG: ABC-2 family transporter protein [Deltaproteobacteria bacterium]|nr:ABC-2 family transporter protein [Deltaproteobacteria bacterium]
MSLRSTARAVPQLLRTGLAETVAYRAEFVVWMLTTTLPLVMLGLWTSVAADGEFRGYSSPDFVAYYLAALIVRNLTGSWVVWQINDEIRRGILAMRLLRPVHPFVAYAASHVAAVPLRGLIALPVTVILLATTARDSLTHDPLQIALILPSLAGAWLLTFAFLFGLGCLAFFIDKSMALLDVYFGVFAVLSGYLIPLSMLPSWLPTVARWLPFRFMLSAPVEVITGRELGAGGAAQLVALQWGYAALILALALALWRAGVRRFEAVGG